jgi:hypothetical protein
MSEVPRTAGLFVSTGLVERPNQLRAAAAGHPHESGLDPGIQVAAAAMLLQERVQRGEQLGHGREDSRVASEAGTQVNRVPR